MKILNKLIRRKQFEIKDIACLTTETEVTFTKCEVLQDGKIAIGKKIVVIATNPHILKFDDSLSFLKKKFGFYGKNKQFRLFTLQKEGEVTHSPNSDEYSADKKKGLEKILEMQGLIAKTDFAGRILAGQEEKKSWFDLLPIIMLFIVSLVAMILLSGIIKV